MRKYLLPENGNFYKANLHCHTTCSDGKLSPEEVKRLYKENGYSIVAYTDHDVFLSHSDLDDENFLALHGYEIEINDTKTPSWLANKTCHMCFIALDPTNMTQVCYHRELYLFGNAINFKNQIKFDESAPDFVRNYTPECVSEAMTTARKSVFFVTYNHPTWSREEYTDYANYNGMHAMEIINGSCVSMGYDEYNERVYEDILRTGKRIYCIATDDNHNFHPVPSRHSDSCRGFTVIKAPTLEYTAITNALINGDFYASEGPEIKELWYEDGKIHISCSDSDRITMSCGIRRSYATYAKYGETINEAEFEVKENDVFVRLTVFGKTGKRAYTNAYFVDELMK